GVYSLADGLKLIATRARLMQSLQGKGAMVAVATPEAQVRESLRGVEERVSIAAVNAANSVVISGYQPEVTAVVERLQASGIRVLPLEVSHAFHSPQMEAMQDEFERVASAVQFQAPRVAMISSVTGRELGRQEISAEYWRRQVREPVRFHQAMETLREKGYAVFVETGPGTTLAGLGKQTIAGEEITWAPSIKKARGEWQQLLESLGKLYAKGAEVNWAGFDAGYARRRVVLPTYPFERQRYWIEENTSGKIAPPWKKTDEAASPAHPLLGAPVDLAGNPGGMVWENRIDTDDLAYLGDHRAFGTAIFPLTAYIEMMAAALESGPATGTRTTHIRISEPLILLPGQVNTVQTVLRGEGIEIYSRENASWKLHVTAQIASAESREDGESVADLKKRITSHFSAEEFYKYVKKRGMDFGPAFQ
ncbi:MAG: acyltransferase domain-containing protein, partial [Bryobacteraceae bacterium]